MNSTVIANEVTQSMTPEVMDRRATLSMNSPVIANAVTQSMTADCMDRHGLRPRDDGVGSWSVCGIEPIRQARSDEVSVQGPCAVSGRIRRARNDSCPFF
ncbi:MAG: hypothetical protein IBX54_02235 [Rhodoferax sp.]|nr:hypothetical protein [Rhodoferax sp.]